MPQIHVMNPGTPSLSQDLGRALGEGLTGGISSSLQQHLQSKKSQKELGALTPYLRQTGMSEEDIGSFVKSGLPTELGVKLVESQLKKKQEDLERFEVGLQTIQSMRDIVKSGHIGKGTAITRLGGGADAKAAAEYEQLGKSLIPLVAAGVPVRNRKEFEEYRKVLTDPNSFDAEIEGALDGIERIFKSKLEGKEVEAEKKASGKLEEGSSHEKLPKASDHPNAIFKKGNKRYVSNGTSWKEMK